MSFEVVILSDTEPNARRQAAMQNPSDRFWVAFFGRAERTGMSCRVIDRSTLVVRLTEMRSSD